MPSDRIKMLKIYIGENEKWHGTALYHALVLKFRELGLAGVTVYRGMEGYGTEKRLRTSRIFDLSVDLPVIVEVVDSEEKIQGAIPYIKNMVKKGLAIVQNVDEIVSDQPL